MSILSSADIDAIFTTLKLAFIVSALLVIVCTPMAFWLSTTRTRLKPIINAVVALPLVLPPTVIGFYFLIAMGPNGPIGTLTQALGIGLLPFTFTGLVIASLIYSLPFVLQPIQSAFEAQPKRLKHIASTLGAAPLERFLCIHLPLAKPGLINGFVMGFAHTMGEFGLVLMIGGNIPQQTRVASVAIYDYVEVINYDNAHTLSLIMLILSFLIVLIAQRFQVPKAPS